MKARGKFVELPTPEFDLRRTLESGQVFHAMSEGDGWQILVDRTPLYAEQRGIMLRVPASHESLARKYFSLDHPLEAIYAACPSDPFSRAALATCRGLRLLRQPQWECLAPHIGSLRQGRRNCENAGWAFGQKASWALRTSSLPEKSTSAR